MEIQTENKNGEGGGKGDKGKRSNELTETGITAFLTSSSALQRLFLRCSLSFSCDLNAAASDRAFRVDGFNLP